MQQKRAHKRRHCPCPVCRMKGMQDAIKQMPMYEGMRKQHQRDKSAVGEVLGSGYVCICIGAGLIGRIIFKLPVVHDHARSSPCLQWFARL